MRIGARIFGVLVERIVSLAPEMALAALRKNHLDLVAGKGAKPRSDFKWGQIELPSRPESFEHLAGLFWNSPLNRGLLRQDFDEAAVLFQIIRTVPGARGVEIGRFAGGSTLLLATAVGPKGKLLSIDLSPPDDTALTQVLNRTGLAGRVELLIGDAQAVQWTEPIDFVFIDGDHTYEAAKSDHNKWGSIVTKGGYIIHHDMGHSREHATQWKELARLKRDILSKQSAELELKVEAGSLSVFRRLTQSWTDI